MIFLDEIDYDKWSRQRCVKPNYLYGDWKTRLRHLTKKNCKNFCIFKRERIWGFPLYTHVLTIMDTRNGTVKTYQARVRRN